MQYGTWRQNRHTHSLPHRRIHAVLFRIRRQGTPEDGWTINIVITERVIPTKYVKHLTGTNLYEMRVSVGTNEYRTVLFSIDHDNIIEATKIILLNGFLKKSTKDYDKEVAKAQRILKRLELL